MATARKGNEIAQKGNGTMPSDYGMRAAIAIDRLVLGPHRDKTVARLFGVSVRMAKYLRAGQHWTIDRLNRASETIKGFDSYLASPNFNARIEEIERELFQLRADLRGEDYGE